MSERTRRDIVEAYNRLIVEKRFDKITVDDIAREAMVSRSTFYRYFKDRYDVMNYNYKRLLDDRVYDGSITNYRDLYRELYLAGSTFLSKISGSFKSSGVNSFEHFIYMYSRETVVRITEMNRGGKGLTESENMQLDVFCYGISFMYRKWVEDRYALDPDTAADKLYEMMPETLKNYWINDGSKPSEDTGPVTLIDGS